MMANWLRLFTLSLQLALLLLVFLSPRRVVAVGLPKPPVKFSVGVEGIVFCKRCKFPGYNRDMDASPIPGAIATLRCYNGRRAVSLKARTDNNGYFLIQTSSLTTFTSNKCRVFVKPSPTTSYCNILVYPRSPGASLKFEKVLKLPFGLEGLYTAGVFVFAPSVPTCPSHP
ncbi:pistil-specific extensin-like protein [Ananas comosus]|uniref:Pistil-specific extensin-like protein n=1 Tax=Ananas comosus TaxID=4615 RepID=A0A6P5G1L4_ANACO|nr:pistil-specific extensin-like protein [Ananas comosus]